MKGRGDHARGREKTREDAEGELQGPKNIFQTPKDITALRHASRAQDTVADLLIGDALCFIFYLCMCSALILLSFCYDLCLLLVMIYLLFVMLYFLFLLFF